MTWVAFCGGLAFTLTAIAVVWLWNDHVGQRELEEEQSWADHVADACDLAFDPDMAEFTEWEKEIAS